ncbi:hypothetical protein NJ7G_1519 [Natrinema sp. J7-2]|nr:hypothetical protein NJ7G_1519 [Natrinema sp. J7-2]
MRRRPRRSDGYSIRIRPRIGTGLRINAVLIGSVGPSQ